MKPINKTKIILLCIIFLFSCEEPSSSDEIWNENDQGGFAPIINSLMPSDNAFAGIDTIQISGDNFSDNLIENHVYFNGISGTIISSSANTINVVPPNLVGDSIKITVSVQGAFTFGKYENLYSLTAAVMDYGPFDQFTDIYSLDLDRQENLLVSMDAAPDAQFWSVNIDQDSSVWSSSLVKASGMKLGPNGSLYFVNYQRFLYRDEQGTPKENSEIFKRLNGNATDLDFDVNGNLYLGGTGSTIDVVDINDEGGLTDGVTESVNLDTLDVISLKVYDQFLYILTTTVSSDQVVYRAPILDDIGSLGDLEIIFDWSAYTNKEASALCITLNETGDLFIGSNWDSQPLTIVQNGVASGFYSSILSEPVNYMAWGNEHYLYALSRNEDSRKVLRIDTRMMGSEYYGRP